ncbi:predicted protein [Naegleria gruberi]|uniref:Predicted protein n=1 Tax=Naegleria gruberi TaxID=5762 RepID=D2VUX8_NAEGR|nr:uncharacterized protein NAEGRDRAFT_72822 [Naegleria gruberi]EFC39397.1 predicted protein [Naegleria gruberi]|eukprot:XP_002672141.1 predicted protein [Naegleria gruberi strain NEG-M]
MTLKQHNKEIAIHHHNHHSEEDLERIYKNFIPIPFSSALRERLQLLSLNPPIGCVETTLSEQYYFHRINDKNFLGHHNLVLAADIIPKSVKLQEGTQDDIEIVRAEGEKLKEKCKKCIDILKYRHPMLCAIPTLKDKLKKKINSKISSHSDNIEKVLHEIWTKEIVQSRGTIQFEIVDQITVDIQVLLDENSINPDNIEIENEEELVKLLINHEIIHSWDILRDPNSVQAMWRLTITKSKHTDGKWVCCFTFFHALCDATSIKIFLEEFASLFDYMYGEVQLVDVEKELMEVKRKALENIHSLLPPSPIQILEMLKSKTAPQKKKNDQSPTETSSSTSSSTSSTPTHHHAESDIPKKLGKLGGLLFYSRFVSQVISYNGLSPIISFPLKSPYPEPAQTKVLIRHTSKLTLTKLIEKTKTLDLTVTAIVQSIGCLAWVLSSRSYNEKAREKTTFGFTNTITVDFREGILLPLGKPKDIFRNYSSALLSTTRLHIPQNISPNNESDIDKLIEIILDGSYQTRNCLNKKYHDTLSTYQIVHKFLKFDISKKESFQMVFSNIGKLENLTGQNVRFELISAAYSAIGNTNGISNIFYTNSRTGELIFSICYPESVHYEHVQRYLENMMTCLELFANHTLSPLLLRKTETKDIATTPVKPHQ